MKDPRLDDMMDPKKMPFDGKRMIYGGFKTIVEKLLVPVAAADAE